MSTLDPNADSHGLGLYSIADSRAHAFQVFISSTFVDLAAERKAVRDALADLNEPLFALGVCLIPVDLQRGAAAQPPTDVCLQKLLGCDLMVTLLGLRAGSLDADGRSITECEFDHARKHNIPTLAYIRDGSVPVLPEHIDQDDKRVAVRKRLKQKIDSSLKRDTFSSPEHLRGHLFRDIFSWLFSQPTVRNRMAAFSTPSSLPEIRKYLDAVTSGDVAEAIRVLTSHRFLLDMRRFGTESIHRELLLDLLELGSLAPPKRVVDDLARSRLLLELLSTFPDSNFAGAALREAQTLEETFAKPEYSFHVARAEAELHARCPRAIPALKRMLKCAWATADAHRVAEGHQAIARYYGSRGEHLKSRRWYWRSISTLCRMVDICPHCLGAAFRGAAGESLNCQDCRTTDNRLIKAYVIGKVIPDRMMQANALAALCAHLAAHAQLDQAVACAVLAARLSRESVPESTETGLPSLLADSIVRYGRGEVSAVLHRVESHAEAILNELIELHEATDFAASLSLKPSPSGDHW